MFFCVFRIVAGVDVVVFRFVVCMCVGHRVPCCCLGSGRCFGVVVVVVGVVVVVVVVVAVVRVAVGVVAVVAIGVALMLLLAVVVL